MRRCNPGKAFKYILFCEFILLLSIISGFLICKIIYLVNSKDHQSSNEIFTGNLWLKNYRILNFFLNKTFSDQHGKKKNTSDSHTRTLNKLKILLRSDLNDLTANKLIKDFLNLKMAEIQLEKERPQDIRRTLFKSKSSYSFIEHYKKKLLLKYYHSQKKYHEVVKAYINDPPKNKEMKMVYLDSLIKTGNIKPATILFKELFQKSHLSSFKIIPTTALNRLITKLNDEFWFKKFYYLAKKNAFREIFREKKYVKSPQLINLFDAEYYYRRRKYQKAKNLLKRVKSENLLDYKLNLLVKIKLRKTKDDYDNILDDIDKLKNSPQLYADFLLNSAHILLRKEKSNTALKLYNKFVCFSQNRDNPDYWKAIWISAWIQFKKNQKKDALKYFRKGQESPILPYKIANQYWTFQLKKNFPHQIDKYPFSYYYTRLANHPSLLTRIILKRFINLINQAQNPLFLEIVAGLKFLIRNNLPDESLYLIKLSKYEKNLSYSDMNMLKIIESIIYLKQKNYYQAFVQFKNNFACYECLYLPNFLSEIYLPVHYENLIKKYSQENNLDPYLVLALIREESFFKSDAVSTAKACGLMQLLFGTAKQVAWNSGQRIYRKDLFIPAINIRLGTTYLKSLFNKYNGETYLALAAYNAGNHKVDRWIEKFGNVPENEFIEMIPYTETRTYVKNIYRNYFFYKFYNMKTNLSP